ncbi:TetR/AcrR family transcriptional regulator [Mesorhizobium sp. RMAD-H1]|uniref:TetR/AcrR family transcriptional regulator n=1 Tax=Mesorhizobium sp. RMAD-H1 TaxID=2587065 RepID=UPI0016106A1D|nr:TetR/AcrR family transcriptional regulator [Mesorhizobium sp. RMAD-H1]MBB2973783.1 TetR/AcrR family transcriptional regulator of autoinduction and epiphytic fitness [Mesorhizobium sp. RMAD-H1]
MNCENKAGPNLTEKVGEENESVCPRQHRLGAGQDPAKRMQILEGARRVFMRMGFDAASMNDITREAGVSKGTIYVYFNSKEELFEALCDESRASMFAGLMADIEHGLSGREALIKFGIALVTLITSEPVIRAQRIVIGVAERMPEVGARFYERGPKRGKALFKKFLDEQVAGGHLAIPDTELAAHQLSELFLAGIYRQRLFGAMPEEPGPEQIRKNVISAVNLFFIAYGPQRDKIEKAAENEDFTISCN